MRCGTLLGIGAIWLWTEGLLGWPGPKAPLNNRLGGQFLQGQFPWIVAETFSSIFGAEESLTEGLGWRTGQEAYRRLQESVGPVGLVWKQTPLREALEGLARSSRIAFLLDRRVDPGQPLELQVENCSLLEAFVAIAQHQRLGICLVGPVVYVGPPESARHLNTLIGMAEEHVQNFPKEIQSHFFQQRPLRWPDLATPREILTELVDSAGLELKGIDRLPHDLWAKASLPPLSLIHQLVLVLQQFDLTFQLSPDGKQIVLVPLPERIALVRSYPAGQDPQGRIQQIIQTTPQVEVRLRGEKIWVRGRIEEHYQIGRLLDPTRNPPNLFWELEKGLHSQTKPTSQPAHSPASAGHQPPIEQIRIESLRIRNKPLREVLELLSMRLGLQFQIRPERLKEAGVNLEEYISLEVRQVNVDQLLQKIFQPLGMRVYRRGRVVEVRP